MKNLLKRVAESEYTEIKDSITSEMLESVMECEYPDSSIEITTNAVGIQVIFKFTDANNCNFRFKLEEAGMTENPILSFLWREV